MAGAENKRETTLLVNISIDRTEIQAATRVVIVDQSDLLGFCDACSTKLRKASKTCQVRNQAIETNPSKTDQNEENTLKKIGC
jgi:hypothetical protein